MADLIAFIRCAVTVTMFVLAPNSLAFEWQSPPAEVMEVLESSQFRKSWRAPTGETLLVADAVIYPALAELAAPKFKLAGIQINPVTNGRIGLLNTISPRLIRTADGVTSSLALPADAKLQDVQWSADGQRFALTVEHPDHIGLWVGSVNGSLSKVQNVALNPLLGGAVSWLPDQKHMLVRRIPQRGAVPVPPVIPSGPMVFDADGASARSTYEARDLLETAHDDALFDYFTTSELVVVDPASGGLEVISEPAPYLMAACSPNGQYVLIQRLIAPWSREVGYWRFASEIEVWNRAGRKVERIASLPVAHQVPVRGVPTGPRSLAWRPTAPDTLIWIEALDGGNPTAKAPHRDRLMRLDAPFTSAPREIFRAEHRIDPRGNAWTAEDGTLMLTQHDWSRRRRHFWLVDIDSGSSRQWFDLDEGDRYGDPGMPVLRTLPNGHQVMHEHGDAVYFHGNGATDQGDRPFLDLRELKSGSTTRLFRSRPDRYESFVAFSGGEDRFLICSESALDPPNYHMATLGEPIDAATGEANRDLTLRPVTHFEDPTPQLRQIQTRIVKYQRNDGVPLSFQLYLPAGYKPGKRLPTVLYAYPRDYSDCNTAGQVNGSTQRFMRLYGSSQLFFLLRGYAVLDQVAMPLIGDPKTAYDSFVPQLVAAAEAAVAKAVEIGVTDPERIGVMGHSHGGLMVANLLAHSDLFRAGIARSGSYNKSYQPFGYQTERRSLFTARDAYINNSPTFFADSINEPILIIHGDEDSNPGTRPHQSEVLFEAVRGSGGTARLVLLPFEDHKYRARETIQHVLWEQLRWFDEHLRAAVPEPPTGRND